MVLYYNNMGNFQVSCIDHFIKHYSPTPEVCFGCCCGDEMLKKNSMKTSTES